MARTLDFVKAAVATAALAPAAIGVFSSPADAQQARPSPQPAAASQSTVPKLTARQCFMADEVWKAVVGSVASGVKINPDTLRSWDLFVRPNGDSKSSPTCSGIPEIYVPTRVEQSVLLTTRAILGNPKEKENFDLQMLGGVLATVKRPAALSLLSPSGNGSAPTTN